jgi:D-3-phosphoglycerate dehydrogenase / 2-oxoglutarate reductase
MKLVGIGDLFIPKEYIASGFSRFAEKGVEVEVLDWKLSGFQELQEINLLVERGGSEAYEPPDYLLDAAAEADILVTEFCPVTRRVIERCGNLKAIGVLRAGTENINIKAATDAGIIVFNTPGRNSDAVADFTVGMLICECRNIARGHHGLKNGVWTREYPNSGAIPDLPGKTVGIVGLGEIGRKVAQRLAGFEVEIVAYDPFVDTAPDGIRLVALEELMSVSDFVTIHARHTPQTDKLVSAALIARMKPGAYLINTSRSAIVDEQSLYEALRDGRIAGAALDVFDREPPGIDYPLVQLSNVTITPHMAGGSNDAFLNSPKRLAAEMIKLWDGADSRFVVNREVRELAAEKFGTIRSGSV